MLLLDKPMGGKSKSRPTGEFSEIEPYFDASRGDMIIDITNLEEWKEPDLVLAKESYADSRKKIQVNMLFGPNKTTGSILIKKNVYKLRYSASRVFGYKSKTQTV